MKQKIKFIYIFMIFTMLLTGCNEEQQKKEDVSLLNDYEKSKIESRNDTVIVYDKNNNKILETKEQSKIDYYSKVIGDSVEGKDDKTLKEPADNMGISSGSYHGTSFGTAEYSLNKANGEYVIFWAKNTGKVDIIISINEYSKELTLHPNEEGFVSEEFSKDEQVFTFKAVPTPNGGDIDIDYKIKQSNTNK